MPQLVDAQKLRARAIADPAFVERLKEHPEEALSEVKGRHPLVWDQFVYRAVVLSLGMTVLAVVISGAVVSAQTLTPGDAVAQKEFPASLVAIGSAAVGALSGLLARSPSEAARDN